MTDKRRKLTKAQVKSIQALYKNRVPVSQIAQHFEISVGTVRHHTGHGHVMKSTIPEVLEALAA